MYFIAADKKIPCQRFVCAALQQIELPWSAHMCGLCLSCFGLSLEASRQTHQLMHRDGQPRIFPIVMLVHCCKAASGPRRISPGLRYRSRSRSSSQHGSSPMHAASMASSSQDGGADGSDSGVDSDATSTTNIMFPEYVASSDGNQDVDSSDAAFHADESDENMSPASPRPVPDLHVWLSFSLQPMPNC